MSLFAGVQVNGQPTPDLDTFLSVVEPLKDGDFARVKVCHLETTQQKVSAATPVVPHGSPTVLAGLVIALGMCTSPAYQAHPPITNPSSK